MPERATLVEETPLFGGPGDEPCASEGCADDLSLRSCIGGKLVAGADLLLLRPAFSNATAAYVNTRTGGSGPGSPYRSDLTAVNYDFDATTGLRAFIGYQISPESVIRFTYTDFAAKTQVKSLPTGNWPGGNGSIVFGPYYADALAPGDVLTSTAQINLNLYDLEWARRIAFDAEAGCAAPMWDAAWGAGLRFADTSVATTAFAEVLPTAFPDLLVTTDRSFQGVGPRVAGQLRRYFGAQRRWSGFAFVGAALLVGSLEDTATRLTLDKDRTFESQQVGGTTVIPNLDLSLGGNWQMAQRTNISVGWMLMYFGDLGYAETISTQPTVPGPTSVSSVPLTPSSLTLDGVFFRLSHTF